MKALTLNRATKFYGIGRRRKAALQNCSFECHAGEVVGVVGPNGAGKTTLLRMIAGETSVTSGEVYVNGYSAGTRRARQAVGYVGDPPLLPCELSGVEWLKYLSGHRASHPRERTALLLWAIELADLGEFVGRSISEYSRGMVHRLSLATAAVTGSAVVVIDEALNGVDPLEAGRLRGTIMKIAALGRLVVVASNDLSTLERLATRVLVLWRGRLISDVNVAKLTTERVAEVSLSGSGLSLRDRLLDRFTGSLRTEDGVAVPLVQGLTIEQVIAVCRSERIPVAASRVRFRALEDVLAGAAAAAEEHGHAERCDGGV